ncbi:hypothetical protein VTK56DRAFT_4439 [Thermocarpiscus australiensis]
MQPGNQLTFGLLQAELDFISVRTHPSSLSVLIYLFNRSQTLIPKSSAFHIVLLPGSELRFCLPFIACLIIRTYTLSYALFHQHNVGDDGDDGMIGRREEVHDMRCVFCSDKLNLIAATHLDRHNNEPNALHHRCREAVDSVVSMPNDKQSSS